jgi:Zn-dependent peptidase ImmA (M78 family)/DNA-binding XRE family transcriptional regulator
MMIGNRIKQARLALGLTLDEVVERIDRSITKAALSKYENNRSVPKPKMLISIARALNQKAAYFLREDQPRIEWIAYRRHSTLGRKKQSKIEAFAANYVERYFNLNEIFYPDEIPQFPKPLKVSLPEEAEKIASSLRGDWKLSDYPIKSVTQIVEDKGAVLVDWQEQDKFDGLSGLVDNSFPVIVTNTRMSDDRIRYNICHELGHLLTEVGVDDPRVEEKIAHRFAGAFLVPAESLYRELGTKRRHLSLSELSLLKEKYGISMQALIYRAKDLGLINYNHYRDLNMRFRARGWHRREPVEYSGMESPNRLKLMVARALAEGIVSREKCLNICPEIKGALEVMEPEAEKISHAERLMKLPIGERRKVLEAAGVDAIKVCNNDPELREFDSLDGEEYAEEG